MTIEEFIAKYRPCDEAEKWLRTQPDLQTAWHDARPEWFIWAATQKGVLTESEQRLFACWCVRQVWHLLTDERSRNAIEVAEKFARGEATRDELDAARYAARYAARDAARSAAMAAEWDAARSAAMAAEWDAARSAAMAAAWSAVWDSARAAEWAAARSAQAKYIRDNYIPKTLAVDAAMT
jgi:hypothetical protein